MSTLMLPSLLVLHSKFVKIDSANPEKKMFTDNGHRMRLNDENQPMAIGHLSDSGDMNCIL